ncbi:hypothetical protein LOD99_6205 [Oopsacas minuta]|uniref:TTF-type domain-containing protein n=1 Tax=Oopsacas minuta TaxID=111878 RepID=A0AAV7JN45_9METZ|nr:hypothetical protein LOD99_6205 [Oopsacas minuta]
MTDQLIRLGPAAAHNRSTSYPASKRVYNDGESRYFQNKMLIVERANGELGKREWLCYSPLSGNVYCFQCTIMSTTSKESNNSFIQGFNNWRHFDRVKCHENSLYHRRCTLDLITRKSQHGHVNSELNISIEPERVYWSQVLKRVIAVVKFLGSNRLAFPGTNERFNSINSGNYINTLKLLAKFDTFIAGHIAKYADKGRGSAS